MDDVNPDPAMWATILPSASPTVRKDQPDAKLLVRCNQYTPPFLESRLMKTISFIFLMALLAGCNIESQTEPALDSSTQFMQSNGMRSTPYPMPSEYPITVGKKTVEGVKKIVAKILKVKVGDIRVDAPLSNLKADELDVVEIIMEVEEFFKIEISDEEILGSDEITKLPQKLTVNTLAEFVERKKRQSPK